MGKDKSNIKVTTGKYSTEQARAMNPEIITAKESSRNDQSPQVSRRPYRDTAMTMPRLGFGLMRLPQKDGKIDYAIAEAMVAKAMAGGCNYFDTAYMYHNGDSERFVGDVLTHYPRESYLLTSKMPLAMMKSAEDNERIFKEQLERTKAGYFDFYFLHWLNAQHWEQAQSWGTLEFMKKMQAEGKIRRIGFSFHGEPETLEAIADAYPWDLVQIQLNYMDWEMCRAREQYELLTKRNIPVSVMEPLKGGTLVKLTPKAREIFEKAAPTASVASWGLRFAASLPNVQIVLSGMSSMEQMEDNLRSFSPLKPLDDTERATIAEALAIFHQTGTVPCTGCRYCSPCPKGVDIPRNLAILNLLKGGLSVFQTKLAYDALQPQARATSCVSCGACLKKCPQQINIPSFMSQITKELV